MTDIYIAAKCWLAWNKKHDMEEYSCSLVEGLLELCNQQNDEINELESRLVKSRGK